VGPAFSDQADAAELRYRDEVEDQGDPLEAVPAWLERKELVARLEYALDRAGLHPAGTVVELGAGSCWLAAWLARRPEVRRVIGIEFARRRLERLAPVAIAALDAPPEKVERVVADFYAHGLEPGCADMVVMDAAFHHAADPVRLARVAYELLRPGGRFVLFREPTLSLLRRSRDHGVEDDHGSFEREYDARDYLRFLEQAGFEADRAPSSGGFATPRRRALLRPPLSWANGVLYSEYTYVGVRR
jgi:SAM-dependent methyltransferase